MAEDRPAFPSIRLNRPRTLVGWIVRLRLLERLDKVLQQPVALISAPAGFGQITLISQWLDHCPLPNAWLQLGVTVGSYTAAKGWFSVRIGSMSIFVTAASLDNRSRIDMANKVWNRKSQMFSVQC